MAWFSLKKTASRLARVSMYIGKTQSECGAVIEWVVMRNYFVPVSRCLVFTPVSARHIFHTRGHAACWNRAAGNALVLRGLAFREPVLALCHQQPAPIAGRKANVSMGVARAAVQGPSM
jgi:hypothetical protein